MIRKYEPWDSDSVMEIWLDANCSAHGFIDRDYFENAFETVKEMIPKAEVYVCEEDDGEIKGFIGLKEGYMEGLFVKPVCQGNGIGKELLDYAKERKDLLTLNVYRKNERAFNFYRREDFNVSELSVDETTGEAEITMEWCRA